MPWNYERTDHSSMSMTRRFILDGLPLHFTRGPVQDAIRWMFNFKRTITVLLLVCCGTTICILLVDFQHQHPNLVVIRQIPSNTNTSYSMVGNETNVGALNVVKIRNIDAMMNTLGEEQEQETDSRQSSNATITNRTDTSNQMTKYSSKFLAHPHEIISPIMVPTVIDWFRNNKTVNNTNATHEENWNGEDSLLLLLNQSSDSEKNNASPSFLRTEVQSILHYPEESKIVVNFVNSTRRRCLRPRIFGRLSGQYLAMVRWDHDVRGKLSQRGDSASGIENKSQKVDVITGYYNLPAKGRYFIEIIGLLCNDFSFDENFNPTCLEDPVTNHLTAPGSFIDVYNISPVNDDPENKETVRCWEVVESPPATGSQNNVIASIGFWKWAKRDEKAIPLSTRYQGQKCRGSNEDRCMVSGSLDRFQPYEFQWSCSEQLSPVDFDQVTNGGNLTLCAVGNSHSRELVTHLNYWRVMYNLTNVNMVWVPLSYPHEMRWNWQTRKALGCNLAIVGLGQWPAGKKPRNPNAPATILPQYMKDLNAGVQRWRQYGIKLALRKIHYNPLGDLITQCPPLDHRSPPVIDGYNEIVQFVAKKYNVTFIDTSDVMDVMWDSAEDYCHYRGLQGRTEALLILHEALKNERILHDMEPSNNTK